MNTFLNDRRDPANFYELVGQKKLEPDTNLLSKATLIQYRELHHYQDSRDKAKAIRAMALQQEVGKAQQIFQDEQLKTSYDRQLIQYMSKLLAEITASGAWSRDQLNTWLREEQAVAEARIDEVATLLSPAAPRKEEKNPASSPSRPSRLNTDEDEDEYQLEVPIELPASLLAPELTAAILKAGVGGKMSKSLLSNPWATPPEESEWPVLLWLQEPLVWAAAAIVGVLFLVLIFAAITMFSPAVREGAVRFEIDSPDIEVSIKETEGIIIAQSQEVILPVGLHTLVVKKGELAFETRSLLVKQNETITVSVELLSNRIEVRQGKVVIGESKLPDNQPAETNRAEAPAPANTDDLSSPGQRLLSLEPSDVVVRVEIKDPGIEVSIKGRDVFFTQTNQLQELELSPGEHTLIVRRGDITFETKLVVSQGRTTNVRVEWFSGRIQVWEMIGATELPASSTTQASEKAPL